jgi:hypothetical protein
MEADEIYQELFLSGDLITSLFIVIVRWFGKIEITWYVLFKVDKGMGAMYDRSVKTNFRR